jgi:surface polysaccharide O-acyltransferase-like enzyme
VSESKSIIWVDSLRVIATFSVVFLHSAAPLLYKFNELPEEYWWYGNFYDSMVRMCVPLFFMISGYLLLGKQESLKVFFQKRVNKVFFPLAAWSIIYVLWKAYFEYSATISFYSIYSLALAPAYYHLWFLYAIIGVYLFLPILRIVVANSNSTLLTYYLFVWFVAVSVIPFGEKITGIESKIDLLSISGYSGYLVFGYCLGKLKITKNMALIASFTFLITVIITAVGTYYLTINNDGKFSGYFYGYLSPNVIFMAASFFIMAKYFVCNNKFFATPTAIKVLTSLSSASLGIYLIHTMYLYALKNGDLGFVLDGSYIHSAVGIPATAILTFILSYSTIIIIKKTPILRRISP